ncbi:MAG: DNA translocase FtsK 4TM domain-containing protein [Pseudomonadota bacterium]
MPKTTIRPSFRSSLTAFWRRRWLPPAASEALARLVNKLAALALMLGAAWLLVAMISYNPTDPSWNSTTVTTGETPEIVIHNWSGPQGAAVADTLLQIFGLGGFLVAISLFTWSCAWWQQGRAGIGPWRIIFMVTGMILIIMALSAVPMGLQQAMTPYYWGGSLGYVLFRPVSDWVNHFVPMVGGMIAAAPLAFFGFIIWAWVSLLRWHHALALWDGMTLFAARVGGLFMAAFPHTAQPEKPARRRTLDTDGHDTDMAHMDEDEDADMLPPVPRSKSKPAVIAPHVKTPAKKAEPQQLSMPDPSAWELPSRELLKPLPIKQEAEQIDEVALRRNADMLQGVLAEYTVKGDITSIHPGPVVTLYELEPAPGTKSARVINLTDDIARSMSAVSVRAAVVPGRNVIGIEIPNKKRQTVFFREMLEMEAASVHPARLPLILGKDIGGEPIVADLARMPHLLVAGTTGSGKSVAVNTMILSLLYHLTPDQCRFIMIDPKMLELSIYDDIPHLLSPVVTEPGRAVVALKWVVREMENRYRAMSKLGVRNIDGYNARLREAKKTGEVLMRKIQTGYDADTGKPVYEDQALDLTELPYIVVVVDEFADLMLVAGKDVEASIQRLAQMARAAGIHLIMATQRPSVDVITGVIKANFPTRISFQVTSKIDSRTILGESGAEQLLGAGDMLYMASGGRITRVHGPFVADQDVESVVKYWRMQGTPTYIDGVTDDIDGGGGDAYGGLSGESGGSGDELYDRAVALVARERKASTSFIQRHLQVGYNRAATLIEKMEKEGVVGPANHVGKREVLIGDHSGDY